MPPSRLIYHGRLYGDVMFEGQIDKSGTTDPREAEVLRQFRWTDLVARLAATRELRQELSRTAEGGFDSFAALRREVGETGKSAVNHDGLNHGKGSVVKLDVAARGAVQGDRENK